MAKVGGKVESGVGQVNRKDEPDVLALVETGNCPEQVEIAHLSVLGEIL